ncbi:MAG: hypothetical protein JJ879_01100 [Sneathiella sp.]|nr:hypothetical protein [Sneathiella sp.]
MIDPRLLDLFIGSVLSIIAGLPIFIGALIASKKLFHRALVEQEFRHGVTAFGGGALVSAICFVLLPQSIDVSHPALVLASFASGGIVFMAADMCLAKMKSNSSLLVATMLDFVPEAMVLGVLFSSSDNPISSAIFITAVICAQNLPEGYSAFQEVELKTKGEGSKKSLLMFLGISLLGPLFFFIGYTVLADWGVGLSIMTAFCAGGILYLVFEDIAPAAAMKNSWLPPLGAVLGFMVGLAGHLLV